MNKNKYVKISGEKNFFCEFVHRINNNYLYIIYTHLYIHIIYKCRKYLHIKQVFIKNVLFVKKWINKLTILYNLRSFLHPEKNFV